MTGQLALWLLSDYTYTQTPNRPCPLLHCFWLLGLTAITKTSLLILAYNNIFSLTCSDDENNDPANPRDSKLFTKICSITHHQITLPEIHTDLYIHFSIACCFIIESFSLTTQKLTRESKFGCYTWCSHARKGGFWPRMQVGGTSRRSQFSVHAKYCFRGSMPS